MDNDNLSQGEIDAYGRRMRRPYGLSRRQESPSPDAAQGPSQPEPLLSQDEIDSLLNSDFLALGDPRAVPSADIPLRQGQSPSPATLSGTDAISSGHRNVEKYDFTMPSRVSKDHLRSLRTLHNSYAQALGSSFSMTLRAVVEVECTHIEQLTYGEYLSSLLEPSCIGVFSMNPLRGHGAMELNSPLVFPIIDKLLGGSGTPKFYNRPLTNIEEMVISKVMERMLRILQESWQRSIKLEMKLERLESNPQFAQVAATSDPVILIMFEVRLDEVQSMMSLCFPFLTIQNALASLRWEEFPALIDGETIELYRDVMCAHVQNMLVTVCARYESSQVTLGELLELQKGDIIKLQNADKNEVAIFIAGQKKLYGKPGMVNGRRAAQVQRFL